jgi:hypothetical protein
MSSAITGLTESLAEAFKSNEVELWCDTACGLIAAVRPGRGPPPAGAANPAISFDLGPLAGEDGNSGEKTDESASKKPKKAMCSSCGELIMSKNMARHKLKSCPSLDDSPAEPGPPPRTPVSALPPAPPPLTAAGALSPLTSAPSTPTAGAAHSAAAKTPAPMTTPQIRRYSESMPMIDENNPHIKMFLLSLQNRGKDMTQAAQDVKRVRKIMALMGGAKNWTPVDYRDRLPQLLTSPKDVDMAVSTLRTTMGDKAVVNWLQSLSAFADYISKSETTETDNTRRNIAVFVQHVKDIKAGSTKAVARLAAESHTIEAYREQKKWMDWADIAALVTAQIPRVAEIIAKCKTGGAPTRVPTAELHFCTMACAILADIDSTAKRGGEDPELLAAPVIEALGKEPTYICNTHFKTARKYGMKAYILTDRVRALWLDYYNYVRPCLVALNKDGETSSYFFLSKTGGKLKTYAHDTTKWFKKASGDPELHINHTQLRKIEATTAAETASHDDADAMRVNRSHTDTTSRIFYQKRDAKEAAKKAARARARSLGTALPASLQTPSDEAESKRLCVTPELYFSEREAASGGGASTVAESENEGADASDTGDDENSDDGENDDENDDDGSENASSDNGDGSGDDSGDEDMPAEESSEE